MFSCHRSSFFNIRDISLWASPAPAMLPSVAECRVKYFPTEFLPQPHTTILRATWTFACTSSNIATVPLLTPPFLKAPIVVPANLTSSPSAPQYQWAWIMYSISVRVFCLIISICQPTFHLVILKILYLILRNEFTICRV